MSSPSRRKVITGISLAPLIGSAAATTASADPALILCAHYVELQKRQEMLLLRWSDVEAWLGENRDWFKLSPEAQRRLPEGKVLRAIDDELEQIAGHSARAVRRLGACPARTLAGAVAKLNVVADVIDPDDYPGAHDVLLSAVEDLRALSSPP
ncbi:MAG: hypothetical protein WDN76_04630 [Alphaproteobacteria bacterium]